MKPVAVFAATRWELRALHRALPTAQASTIGDVRCLIGQRAGRTYWLIQTGVGPDAAGKAAALVMARQPMGSVISAGFACALIPARVGDLMVATEVRAVEQHGEWVVNHEGIRCDQALFTQISAAVQRADQSIIRGAFLSSPAVVWQADDKRRLSHLSGAVALDMESATLAAVASRYGTPFAIVRTVSDLVDEDLPLDFNLFLRPTGWLSGMRSLFTHPSSFAGLNRLRKQSRKAAERLTELFESYMAEEPQQGRS